MKVPYTGAQNAVDSFHCRSLRPRVIGSLQPVTFAERTSDGGTNKDGVSAHLLSANALQMLTYFQYRTLLHGATSRYHLGGRVETDTVAMADRLERRQGDEPSQTPPFTSLVARHEVSQGTEEPPPQLPTRGTFGPP